MTNDEVLAVDDVVAGYVPGVDILRGVSIRVCDGEVVTVVGPNGAGKSTLVKAIFGLVSVRSGRIRLRGADITGQRPHDITRRGMTYVPQLDNVFPSLTVNENLELGSLDRSATSERMETVLDLFPQLVKRRRQPVGTMSGGERQMVAMGRALMAGPSVLLLDEPSAGLAPALVDATFERVERINRAGITVVIVEQNARRALALSDRGYVLDTGGNRFEGAGRDLLADEEVAELYLGGAGGRGDQDGPARAGPS